MPSSTANLVTHISPAETSAKQYQNSESFDGTPLSEFAKENLFVTHDNYCFVVSELVDILNKQNRFFNPYTGQDLQPEEIRKLMEDPAIKNQQKVSHLRQKFCAEHISPGTIKALIQLTEGLFNPKEIHASKHMPVRQAQAAYEIFNQHLVTLTEVEREALNDFWIEGFDTFVDGFYGIGGMKTMKFGDLYTNVDDHCLHSIGAMFVIMVLQLDPNAKFRFQEYIVVNFVDHMKSTRDYDVSDFAAFSHPEYDTAWKKARRFVHRHAVVFTPLAWLAFGCLAAMILILGVGLTLPTTPLTVLFPAATALIGAAGYCVAFTFSTLATLFYQAIFPLPNKTSDEVHTNEATEVHHRHALNAITTENSENDDNHFTKPAENEKPTNEIRVSHGKGSPRFSFSKEASPNEDPSDETRPSRAHLPYPK